MNGFGSAALFKVNMQFKQAKQDVVLAKYIKQQSYRELNQLDARV